MHGYWTKYQVILSICSYNEWVKKISTLCKPYVTAYHFLVADKIRSMFNSSSDKWEQKCVDDWTVEQADEQDIVPTLRVGYI